MTSEAKCETASLMKELSKLAAETKDTEDDNTRHSTSINDADSGWTSGSKGTAYERTMTEHMAAIFNYKILPAGFRLTLVEPHDHKRSSKPHEIDWGRRIPTSRQI